MYHICDKEARHLIIQISPAYIILHPFGCGLLIAEKEGFVCILLGKIMVSLRHAIASNSHPDWHAIYHYPFLKI